VVDKTALPGKYDFALNWTADANPSPDAGSASESADAAGDSTSSLFAAIHEQLGLRLEPQKAPTPVLVIDHVEKQTEN
jgi:uncharacterized protein (TIGR03435 family)